MGFEIDKRFRGDDYIDKDESEQFKEESNNPGLSTS